MRKLKLEELGRPSLAAFRRSPKRPIVLLLDNIRSGLNVGSIFRTADAFAIDQIILCGITAQPPHREVLKSAIGATESVVWDYRPSAADAILNLKEEGYKIWGVEQTDQSKPLHTLRWGEIPCVLVFGNEVHGLSDDTLPLLDQAIEIPQFGSKHSLNVAVCAGIVLHHLTAQSLNPK